MCIFFVRLQSDFISLYEFEEALMHKLYIVILTMCAVQLDSSSATGVQISDCSGSLWTRHMTTIRDPVVLRHVSDLLWCQVDLPNCNCTRMRSVCRCHHFYNKKQNILYTLCHYFWDNRVSKWFTAFQSVLCVWIERGGVLKTLQYNINDLCSFEKLN